MRDILIIDDVPFHHIIVVLVSFGSAIKVLRCDCFLIIACEQLRMAR